MHASFVSILKATYLIALGALLTGTPGAFSQTIRVTDDAGATVVLAQPARRIVSLAPNLTEMVFAVGAGERLVGVSRYSDFPEAAKQLPMVSDAYALNLEAILALKPDLILVWQTGSAERQRDALKAMAVRLKVPVYESEIRDVQGVASTLERLGRLTGTGHTADAAARSFTADWAALGARYRGARPVRVFYQLWDAPLMTFNGQHLVSKAIALCGGVNGFDSLSALTPTVSREAVLAFNPQLILSDQPDPKVPALEAWRKLPQIDAVRLGLLAGVQGDVLTRMGPRFVQATADLCTVIDRARMAIR